VKSNAWLAWFGFALTLVAGVCIGAYLRHQLVEPSVVAQACVSQSSVICLLRDWTILGFTHERLGWFALLLAGASFGGPYSFRLVALGLSGFAAGLGLVLYNAELCAPAVLVAGLSLVRALRKPASPITTQHSAKPSA
jgi:hypothetical protein